MNCVHWRHEGNAVFPSWRDREDYLERFGPRALLWVGELREAQAWGWTPPALCTALRGRIQVDNRGCCVELGASDVLLTEGGNGLRVDTVGGEARVAVLWLAPAGLRGRASVDPLPAFFAQDSELAIALNRLAQSASDLSVDTHAVLDQLLSLLSRRQQDLAQALANCPGRSDRHRRQLYARLLRAKHVIDHGQAVPLDLAALAQVASLSPSHFLRLFHRVFGASPHRYLVQQRMLRARRMVVETSVPIGTIAQRMGFINRCAFARLFKQQFGTPATRLRRMALMQARASVTRAFGVVGNGGARVTYSHQPEAA
ncbi:MAG: helix-turn-helix transcriptional regulator [Rhodanobacteraceae bacterium]|nr:helix-turn-helix transcriptional regulator [Rhodanobacteraceae bacterium]